MEEQGHGGPPSVGTIKSERIPGYNSIRAAKFGVLAHLGERFPCKEEVVGSSPTYSTNFTRFMVTDSKLMRTVNKWKMTPAGLGAALKADGTERFGLRVHPSSAIFASNNRGVAQSG